MIFKDVEIRFAKLNPKKPSMKFAEKTSGRWEVQMVSRKKEQKAEWEAAGLKVKIAEDDDGVYYKASVSRGVMKSDGTKAECPSVVNGQLVAIDPTTIGNGTICNIRTFPREYVFEGTPGIKHVLMGIQITKHVVFKGKPMEEFDDVGETQTILPMPDEGGEDGIPAHDVGF